METSGKYFITNIQTDILIEYDARLTAFSVTQERKTDIEIQTYKQKDRLEC